LSAEQNHPTSLLKTRWQWPNWQLLLITLIPCIVNWTLISRQYPNDLMDHGRLWQFRIIITIIKCYLHRICFWIRHYINALKPCMLLSKYSYTKIFHLHIILLQYILLSNITSILFTIKYKHVRKTEFMFHFMFVGNAIPSSTTG